MWTTDSNHGAQTQFHSGRHMLDGEFPDARRLGPLRPRHAERQPAAVHLDRHARVLEQARTATTSARRTTPCRCASIPSNPLDFGRPERPFSAEAQSDRHRPDRRAQRAARRRVSRRSGAGGPHRVVRAGLPHADGRCPR